MKDMALILVDDSQIGFWRRGAGWLDADWAEYDVYRLSGKTYGSSEAIIDGAVDLALRYSRAYVVTDGTLWSDPFGGGNLLEKMRACARGVFIRGVVFSEDPQLKTERECMMRSGRVPAEVRVAEIREFLETGKKPAEVVRNEAGKVLSAAIHGLENLAIPLAADADTLVASADEDNEPDKELLREIWNDYFGVGGGPDGSTAGYMMPDRNFPPSSRGIEEEIARLLHPAVGLSCLSGVSWVSRFVDVDKISAVKVANELGISSLRDSAPTYNSEIDKLQRSPDPHVWRQLAGRIARSFMTVSGAIRKMAADLRMVRNAEAPSGGKAT